MRYAICLAAFLILISSYSAFAGVAIDPNILFENAEIEFFNNNYEKAFENGKNAIYNKLSGENRKKCSCMLNTLSFELKKYSEIQNLNLKCDEKYKNIYEIFLNYNKESIDYISPKIFNNIKIGDCLSYINKNYNMKPILKMYNGEIYPIIWKASWA